MYMGSHECFRSIRGQGPHELYRCGALIVKDSIGVGIYNIIFPISISRSLGIWLSVLCTGKVSIDTTYCICMSVQNCESQDSVAQTFSDFYAPMLVVIEG